MQQSANIRKRRLTAYTDRHDPINDDEPGPSFIKQKCHPNSILLLNPPVRSTDRSVAKILPKKRPYIRQKNINNLIALSIVSKRNQLESEKALPNNLIDLNSFKHVPIQNEPEFGKTYHRFVHTTDISQEADPKMPKRYEIAPVRLANIKKVIAKTKLSMRHLPGWKKKKAFIILHRIAMEQQFHNDIVQKHEFIERCHSRIDEFITNCLERCRIQTEAESNLGISSLKPADSEPSYDSSDDGCPIDGALLNESRLNSSSELFDAIFNEKSPPKPKEIKTRSVNTRKKTVPTCPELPTPSPSPSPPSSASSVSDIEACIHYPFSNIDNLDFVTIGPNGTMIRLNEFCKIPWDKPVHVVTKRISTYVFGNETLATHTLPNMNSPPRTGQKKILDPSKLSDIVHIVISRKEGVTDGQVYAAIKAKCLQQRAWKKKKQAKEQCEPKLNVTP